MDFGKTTELLIHDLADFRVAVHREYDLDVVELLGQAAQSLIDMTHRFAEILATMRRHEDDALMREINLLEQLILELKIIIHRMMQRIDNRIAGHEYALRRHGLAQQVLLARLRRSEVEISDATGQLAVHLLRERRIFVIRAQSGLDMANSRLMIVGSQRTGKRRRRIAMDEHDIRLSLGQDLVQALHRPRRDVEQRLPLRHDIEIIVRMDVEKRQNLVQHFAVLGRHRHDGLYLVGMLRELQHDRSHLDRLRTRPEDRHDFDFLLFHVLSSMTRHKKAGSRLPPINGVFNADGQIVRSYSCGIYRASLPPEVPLPPPGRR